VKLSLKLCFAPLLALFAVVASLPRHPALGGIGSDSEVFRYIGMVIAKGGMPYRDVFDHKPPLIYLMAALTHFSGRTALWYLETGMLCLALLAFFFSVATRRWPLFFLFPFYYAALVRTDIFFSHGALTRSFGSLFILLTLTLMFFRGRARFFLFGAGAATVFFFQQNDAPALIFPFLYLLSQEGPNKTAKLVRACLECGIGVLAVALPLLGWIYHHGAWQDFMSQAFGYNNGILQQKLSTLLAAPVRTLGMHYFQTWALFFLALLVVLAPTLRKRATGGAPGPLPFLLLGFYTHLVLININGYLFPHYFLSILPWLIFVTGETLRLTDEKFGSQLPPRLLYVIALGFLFTLPNKNLGRIWHEGAEAAQRLRNNPAIIAPENDPSLKKILESIAGQDGQFLVFDSPPDLVLNTQYNILSPTKWNVALYWHVMDQKIWDPDLSKMREMLSQIEGQKTKYILHCEVAAGYTPEAHQMWQSFLHAHYQLERPSLCGTLWQRKI
jgi:hypothetical protein